MSFGSKGDTGEINCVPIPCDEHSIEERIADVISLVPEIMLDRRFSLQINVTRFELDTLSEKIM